MKTLYIANKNYSSWSLRPWLLMQVLEIPFTEQIRPLIEGGCWDEYREFSPNGRVPCLHDDGRVIWESLAITEYLAEDYPAVWPQDADARAWARCAAAEMHAGFSALRNECPLCCAIRVQKHAISPALQHDLDRMDELWNEGLDRFGGPFVAGQAFSAADAFFAPVAFRVQTYQLPMSPSAMAYVQRLFELKPMQGWYAAALEEPWRELSHDREIEDSGVIIEDLRAPAGTGD
ncbi:MAG: glutathione S-transferase [Xanthomonadales bacterium]|nr:glutathione S-transferase [Xanthomonadales bacterium]